MNRSALLRAEAEHDLSSAASWYEQQRIGLGSEFLDEALAVFRPGQGHLVVFAVLHASRDPQHWMRRIQGTVNRADPPTSPGARGHRCRLGAAGEMPYDFKKRAVSIGGARGL